MSENAQNNQEHIMDYGDINITYRNYESDKRDRMRNAEHERQVNEARRNNRRRRRSDSV